MIIRLEGGPRDADFIDLPEGVHTLLMRDYSYALKPHYTDDAHYGIYMTMYYFPPETRDKKL